MKTLIRALVAIALLIAAAIATIHYVQESRERRETEEMEQAKAEFMAMLADEDQHILPEVPETVTPEAVDLEWQLATLDGEEVSLAEFRGKTIFIDTWATWCKPCVAQMPSIQRLYDAHPGEEYAFLLISTEYEDPERVRKYIEEKGYTFPVYLTTKERPPMFQRPTVPWTYVINAAGEVVYKDHGGPRKWDHESFVEFFRGLTS